MRKTHALVSLLVLAAAIGCSPSEAPAPPLSNPAPATDEALIDDLTAKVDATMGAALDDHHLPGAAVVIVKDGETILQRGYGMANLERGHPVDPETTLFRIGSISKALTLLTLTRLVDDGRLSLDDDVDTLFEGIENPFGFQSPITVEHLLTHTAGLDQIGSGRHIRHFDLSLPERKALRPSLSEFLGNNLRRATPAGQYFRYDTYGTTLAGALLEQVSGLPYPQGMRQELFLPLGMASSFVEVETEYFGQLATGYGFVDGEYVAQPYEVYLTLPASSIDATPADMGRLLEALTADGANHHGRLFSPATAEAVRQPQFRPHEEFLGMTHGLRESRAGRRYLEVPLRAIGHGGDMLGYKAVMTLLPELNVGVFVVANRNREAGGERVDISRPILDLVIDAFHEGRHGERLIPLPSIQRDRDLSDYVGNYYFGVFCHTCSQDELNQGGWSRGAAKEVTADDGVLTISDQQFIPRGDDVFVQSDGRRMVYFGRDITGKPSFFVYSTSVDTFERVEDGTP